jgi:hypothetical protein
MVRGLRDSGLPSTREKSLPPPAPRRPVPLQSPLNSITWPFAER